eukprot:GFYU01004596.1.p1 GENE.GFYU01004596.1~~GFYU01004596.1.p1  ORF type:complete len:554 (+),score=165.01 GFYU01004596.1:181-1842(+)
MDIFATNTSGSTLQDLLTIAVCTAAAIGLIELFLSHRRREALYKSCGRYYWQNSSGQYLHGAEPIHQKLKNEPVSSVVKQLVMYDESHLDKTPGNPYMVHGVCDNPALVLSDPNVVKGHFKDQMNHVKDPGFGLGYLSTQILGQSVGAKVGKEWVRVRKPFVHGYTSGKVVDTFPMVLAETKTWLQNEIHASQRFELIASWPRSSLANYGFRIVAKTVYGDDLTDAEFDELVYLKNMLFDLEKGLFPLMNQGVNKSKLPFYEYLPTQMAAQLKEFTTRWNTFNRCYLTKVDATKDEREDVFSMVASGMAKGTITMTEQEFFHTVNEILLANVEVAACVLSWALVHVAMYKGVQDKLIKEIDELLEKGGDVTVWDDINNLEYLDMMLKESARYKPPAEYNLPENLPNDEVLHDFLIPRHTPVILNIYKLNRHPGHWTNPDDFEPERFRPNVDGTKSYDEHAFFRFGLGPRKCLGYRLAGSILKTLIATTLKDYTISVEGGSENVKEFRKGTFVGPETTLLFHPRKPNMKIAHMSQARPTENDANVCYVVNGQHA